MEKLKNFFYSKNDIIIAIFILVIAVSIIGFRVSKILAYPQNLINNQNIKTEAPVSSSPDKDKSEDKKEDTEADQESSEDSEKETETNSSENSSNEE